MISENMAKFIVVGTKRWSRQVFNETISNYPGNWHFIENSEQINITTIEQINPRYVFFLHWSYKVPSEVVDKYECICFHMTDVPYGRGGSPLQNLILRGHKETKLTALRMIDEIDAGPIYLQKSLRIDTGTAETIYIQASQTMAEMIKQIISEPIEPVPQQGEVTIFKRRQPNESEIPDIDDLKKLHDFIRMLDADEYPRAFIKIKGLRIEFSQSTLYDDKVTAQVTITSIDPNKR